MTNNGHNISTTEPLSATTSMLATVRAELAGDYVEVAVEGISFGRLLCIYVAGAEEAKHRILHALRSFLRIHPAH